MDSVHDLANDIPFLPICLLQFRIKFIDKPEEVVPAIDIEDILIRTIIALLNELFGSIPEGLSIFPPNNCGSFQEPCEAECNNRSRHKCQREEFDLREHRGRGARGDDRVKGWIWVSCFK